MFTFPDVTVSQEVVNGARLGGGDDDYRRSGAMRSLRHKVTVV
ncbi:MAG: hypothetical protein AAF191_04465 [Verrucomicrobiota bacterium]